ncbi:MAG: TetR/AcrR family transcriptional regulator [Planctomycetes bacterium]|nr:TetR/AcrR family transcriptional regulator [Planctomycetota bacterium]
MNQPTTTEPEAFLEPGTRTQVLKAAARLFAERGFDAVSVREIVQAAGVTKPAMYYHFGSKEGVATAIMHDLLAAADEVRKRAFAESKDIRQALAMHCQGMLELAAQRKHELAFGFTCWFGRSSLRQITAETSDYDCKVNQEWVSFLVDRGLDEQKAVNLVRVFWALLMQELLRVAHCPFWAGDADDTPQTIAGLAMDGALAHGTTTRQGETTS